jgi:hypothetical protein
LLAGASRATELDTIGYPALAARVGALKADGAGVPVAQVEVFFSGTTDYSPDTANAAFAGKTFTLRSGASGVSSHATQVANLFYSAANSPAPDVSAVSLFSADSFLTDLLRTGRSTRAPGSLGAMVVNNSWIADYPTDATNIDALRRLDDLINRDDVLDFNAVSNTGTDPFPTLLASSYNGISVGTLTGSHGPVTFDGGARIKPDIVVDSGATSNASGVAAGAGALLISEARARGLPAGELAIKAILMAGAHRDASWMRGRASGKDNAIAPLDFQQGAGQLRVDHSFDILTAGEQSAGSSIVPAAGWDYARTARTTNEAVYLMHVDQALPQWAAMLTWNRTIAGLKDGHYNTKATMADFALNLYLSKRGGRRLIASSDSPSDNVESLTLTGLAAGDYQIVLTTNLRSYYSLAWYEDPTPASGLAGPAPAMAPSGDEMSAGFAMAPEPSVLGLIAPASALLCLRRRRRV